MLVGSRPIFLILNFCQCTQLNLLHPTQPPPVAQHKALRVATRDEDPQPKRTCMEFVKQGLAPPGPGLTAAVESPLLVTTQTKRTAAGWVRSPTRDYIALTQDYHHPAFIAQMTIPLQKKGGGG